MLKGRGRDPRAAVPPTPTMSIRSASHRPPLTKPEPDYEVVEFPSEQYVNAKLQPPPPPPPRPPTGHPLEASCGLCGGGGARVRCAECGRRALCASCDDMYHRHPKRRHHQRQALSLSQLRDERPPLPPKTGPPIPPPRKHKISGDRSSASPRLPPPDHRRVTLNSMSQNQISGMHVPAAPVSNPNHFTQRAQHPTMPAHLQMNVAQNAHASHLGSLPYLSATMHHTPAPVVSTQEQSNTLGHVPNAWGRQRASLPGFIPPNMSMIPGEPWDTSENAQPSTQSWGRPLRRGTSVMELGVGPPANPSCAGCSHCMGQPWRYGSCASLDHNWVGPWPPTCCVGPHPQQNARVPVHPHAHPPQTPQPYRRADSRAVSRAASRAGSRAASPAMSVRSRTSRRPKHRTPSPPPLPSSDADSESELGSDGSHVNEEDHLGPPPPPPSATWQCEHCTFVNEPGVRVCVVCCRTPTITPKIINAAAVKSGMRQLKISDNRSPSIARSTLEEPVVKNGEEKSKTKKIKERTSTACGPSPPKEERVQKPLSRLATPALDETTSIIENRQTRHDMAVGPSPPKEIQTKTQSNDVPKTSSTKIRSSPYKNNVSENEEPTRHSVSVGPSPPRDQTKMSYNQTSSNSQEKSTGTSPPRENRIDTPSSLRSSTSSRANVSNTGTSPPPQSISTQTYEIPSSREWERAPSATRSRARRRIREEGRRERSHSRHSLSSDTRESERSVRTGGGGSNLAPGRWEWREPRDSSPGAEWSGSERRPTERLTRRASHMDLRRTRSSRRSSVYGSEAPSPEPFSGNRAVSLEALAGAGVRRDTERGLEQARLMGEAEKLGFSAAEVHAALAQNPAAPLAWLRERWPSLCAGVRAAAIRLAPGSVISEREARTALARHRGAMWPAVTDCVEKWRRQAETLGVGSEGRLRGHVWGSPTGVEDDAVPPIDRSHRMRAEESSDELEMMPPAIIPDDDWMYLPLDNNKSNHYEHYSTVPQTEIENRETEDIAQKLKSLLLQAGIPNINEQLLLTGLLANQSNVNTDKDTQLNINNRSLKQNPTDFLQSENDFIDAYNALTRLSPLPNIGNSNNSAETQVHPNYNKNDDNYSVEALNENDYTKNIEPQIPLNISQLNESMKTHEKNFQKQQNILKIQNGRHKLANKTSRKDVTNSDSNSKMMNENLAGPENAQKSEIELDGNEVKENNEKSNNLSDMVDNTQKLIQQMKKELNSDIRSLDSRSNTGNDTDNSSNESDLSSDKETSYDDTENETEELSSDESESKTSQSKKDNNSRNATNNRTSSEDNEQFEEAIDHLEENLNDQLLQSNFHGQDFKLTNMGILDSIAKTLKEEHLLTVHVDARKLTQIEPQDVNNNLFSAVNSFEEIYEQLTDKNENKSNLEDISIVQKSNNVEHTILTNKPNGVKHVIEFVDYKILPATTLLISKDIPPHYNAFIEEINIEMDNDDTSSSNIHTNILETNENTHIDFETEHEPTEIINNTFDNTSNDFPDTVENFVSQSPNTEHEPSHSQNDSDTVNLISETDINEINDEIEIQHNDTSVQDLDQSIADNSKLNSEEHIMVNIVNIMKPAVPTELTNKFANLNKSNIPKLVKAIQNNKAKVEKTSSKIFASKVPIRRTSIKQYPAPAPPKAHFGNIQNGHVKQLQTRLFNSKLQKPTNLTNEIEIQPSTSATNSNKKKPAPLPPPHSEHKNHSPPKEVSQMEKNQFFRETCRTEDEWTDSDSENNQTSYVKKNEEPETTPLSPPPPITMRRISGQLIDLATIRLPEGSPERQARMLLAEGATENWDQAQLAVELISRGIHPPSALLAALECADLNSALAYLHQDCELCASRLPEYEMVSMLRCTHRCCRECARLYFTVQITERSIADCVCPYCKEPELENLPEDAWLEYFAHLDILLKTLLETEVHELFQRKLRDRTLARDPNFKWCVECSSGFFVHPKQKKLRCPECKSVSCASCRKPWSHNHEGLTCEQYTVWLEDNDPERSVAAVQQHLRENGLECPRCHFKYSLSRGGCMHFMCTQCKYEFCYGCGKPFMMGARCGLSEYCAKLGLHAHHPRNCLFYLRDKEPHELQTLLQMNNVTYETEPSEGSTGRCPIQLQRETPTGLVDGPCGSESSPNNAGLCKIHYVEYLAGLARNLDPIPIMDVSELVAELRRRALPLPERGPWDTDPIYAGMCAEIVREKIPLD